MRSKSINTLLLVFILLLSITSCNLPMGNRANVDVDATIAAGIMRSQTALALPLTDTGQATITNTVQPGDTATLTLEPTITLTPTITITPTPEGVFLTISQDTYCRKGAPISVFPALTTIKAGQQVEVIGQNPTHDSYYVRNPDQTNSYCWVWGKYATLTGNQESLPVYTLQPTATSTSTPTPTPAFTVSYAGRSDGCGGFCALNFTITNTGSTTWESYRVDFIDTNTSVSNTGSRNAFYGYGASCAQGPSQDDLTPGETGTAFIYAFGDVNGHTFNVTVTVCSDKNLGGTCASKSLTAVPQF